MIFFIIIIIIIINFLFIFLPVLTALGFVCFLFIPFSPIIMGAVDNGFCMIHPGKRHVPY
jgi:hypothetical protein